MRHFLQDLPYCVRINDLCCHIPECNISSGTLVLDADDAAAIRYIIDTYHKPMTVTLTFIPPGYSITSVTKINLARTRSPWGTWWYSFSTAWGNVRKLWFVPTANRFMCKAEGRILDKQVYSFSKRQRQLFKQKRLAKELLKAHRKYPRLGEFIEMHRELDRLTALNR